MCPHIPHQEKSEIPGKGRGEHLKSKIISYSRQIFIVSIALLSVLASAKSVFFGLNIDEEYAVTMAYRMLGPDEMFYTMWEPHQTSGFLCAIFIKAFLLVTKGNTDYLIVYLRIMGILVHAGVCAYVYRGLKTICSKYYAFLLSVVCFAVLPKWILVPEFSNMLLWVTLCTMSCFLQINSVSVQDKAGLPRSECAGAAREALAQPGHFVLLGILTCIGVLAYPSFLICFPVYCAAIYYMVPATAPASATATRQQTVPTSAPASASSARQQSTTTGKYVNKKRALWIYISTCVVIGLAYVLYFAGKLGVEAFVSGILNMATDGQHETSFVTKAAGNGLELIKCIGIYVLIYGAVYLGSKLLKGYLQRTDKKDCIKDCTIGNENDIRPKVFIGISLISVLWQFLAWAGNGRYMNEPLVLFYHMFLAVLMCCKVKRQEVWCYILPPVASCLAAGMLTNTGIYVISTFLLPAIIYGLARLVKADRRSVGVVILSLAALFLFAKGWLLCENEGYKADMTYVKQKALEGPAKNIYCRYLDGYEYNIVQELVETYVEEDASVLCVSTHTIWYLLGDMNIANYSTISTPTYDERLLEYYDRFPEKYPDVIICQESEAAEKVKEMFGLQEPVAERDGISLYSTSK